MANSYFKKVSGTSFAWDTVANWWTNAACTTAKGSLPAANDTIFIAGHMNSGPSVTRAFTMINVADATTGGGTFGVAIGGATGPATFNAASYNQGTVTGNATFNGTSYNNGGTVTGNATFAYAVGGVCTLSGVMAWGGSLGGTVKGTDGVTITSWVFNESSINNGTVTGNATFNADSLNDNGTVTGNATFNDSSRNSGASVVNGTATFNASSYNDGGSVSGNATFNDSSFNSTQGYANTATFNASSYNQGRVTGDVTFNGNSSNSNSGHVDGNATFNDSSGNYDGTLASGFTVQAGRVASATGANYDGYFYTTPNFVLVPAATGIFGAGSL